MPAKKYHTEEERLEARRAAARRFYESHKNDEAFKESQRLSKKKFNDSNRELVALKSRQFYWSNEKYRNAKLDRLADRYSNDDEYRQKTILAASKRYWDKRTATLEELESREFSGP
jgi:hypothetical protein